MSPATSRVICASLGSWGRRLCLAVSRWLGSMLPWHGEQLWLDFKSSPKSSHNLWSVRGKGLNLAGAGSWRAV